MRTAREESAPPSAGDPEVLNQTYLPSPPQSPQFSGRTNEPFRNGVDNNTASGMAATQEQSLYSDDMNIASEGLCTRDGEKQNPAQYATDMTSISQAVGTPVSHIESNANHAIQLPVSDTAQTPSSLFQQVVTESATESSTESSITHTTKSGYVSPKSSRTTVVPAALFAPSPTPEADAVTTTSESMQGLASEFSKIRITPSFTSSFFRPGSRFTGTQQSERQIYNVDVELLNVSIPDSSVSGYLRICGLTDAHPTLTTYFEGEIIGTQHTFQTRHASWGATDKTDMQHWARFPAWRPLAKEARRPGFTFGKGWWNRENIFMRWKEHFLVPDHRVRSIQGASFEGFYYICYNQVEGRISGIYFHAKAANSGINDRYQQLELKHVPDQGCLGAMEFR